MTLSFEPQIRAYLRASHRVRGLQLVGSVALGTNVGRVRTENQDRLLHVDSSRGRLGAGVHSLTVLADGMGGMANGGEAAEMAVASFISHYIASSVPAADKRLKDAALFADCVVNKQLKGRGGATLVAIVRTSKVAVCVSVGDSRLYTFNPAAGLVQVTRDDTLNELLNREGAAQHVDRGNQLVQFIGLGEGVEPHLYVTDVMAADIMILTTDGAHSIGDELIERLCRANVEPSKLVEAVLSVSSALGGSDNATVAVIGARSGDVAPEAVDQVRIAPPCPGQLVLLPVDIGVDKPLALRDMPAKTYGVNDEIPESDVVPVKSPSGAKGRRRKKKSMGIAAPQGDGDALSFDFPKGT